MYNFNSNAQPYYGDPNVINANNGTYYPSWNVAQYANPQVVNEAPSSSITTAEEAAVLNQMHGVSYEVTPEKMAEKLCDHKEGHKYLAQANPETGWMYCPRCKKTFRIMSKGEDIQSYIDTIDTAFETIKLLNTGLPVDAIRRLGSAIAIVDQTMKPIYESVYAGWDRLNNIAAGPVTVGNINNNGFFGNTAETLANFRMMPGQVYQPAPATPVYGVSPVMPQAGPAVVGNPWDNGGVANPYAAQMATSLYAPQAMMYAAPQQSVAAAVPSAVAPQATTPVANITANPVIPGAVAPQAPVVPVQPGASGPAQAPQPPVAAN